MAPVRSSAMMRPSGATATEIGPDSTPDDEPASVMDRASVPFWNTRMASAPPSRPSAEAATVMPDGPPAASACGAPSTGIVPLYEPSALYIWMRPLPRSSSDIAMRPSAGTTATPVGSMSEDAGEKPPRMIWRDRAPSGPNTRTERSSVLRWSRIRARIEPSGAAATARGASRCESPSSAAENPPAYS